jgi:hypothetical protein
MNFNNVSSTVAENRSLPMQVSSESQGLQAHKSRQGCLNLETKAPFGYDVLKFNSLHINVAANT